MQHVVLPVFTIFPSRIAQTTIVWYACDTLCLCLNNLHGEHERCLGLLKYNNGEGDRVYELGCIKSNHRNVPGFTPAIN